MPATKASTSRRSLNITIIATTSAISDAGPPITPRGTTVEMMMEPGNAPKARRKRGEGGRWSISQTPPKRQR